MLCSLAAALSLSSPVRCGESATELIAAIRAGDRVRVDDLLRRPGQGGARDARGNTPLHWAALAGDEQLVGLLLERGLDASATNNAGATPLHYGTGSARVVGALLRAGAGANARSLAGATPLHTAVARPGAYESVRLLLDAGAEVDVSRPTHILGPVSPLMLAISFGDERTARLLLSRGASPGGAQGATPVRAAAVTGSAELLGELLRRGGAVNLDDGFTGHALNGALYAGHFHLVPFLIEHGADIEQTSSFGERVPPMVWAAYTESGDPAVAEALLRRGADIHATTSAGHTVLDWALRRGETPLVEYLRSRGAAAGASIAPKRKTVPQNAIPPDAGERLSAVRDAAQRAADLLQRSSDGFLANGFVKQAGCVSCHQQTLPAVALGRARERGLRVDEASLARQLHAQLSSWSSTVDAAYEMFEPQPDAPANLGYGLLGLRSLDYAPDELTEAMVWYLARAQLPDGSFPSYDRRPPMEEGRITGTALAVGALRLYPQPLAAVDLQRAFSEARRWLSRVEPENLNQRAFRLLGLLWAGAGPDEWRPAVRELLSLQREDGGWAPLPGLESDAWATGLTLFALHEAGGVESTDEAYRRGVDFLLRTQFPDGSWWVRSRTWPFQPHFDSGFPHGKDQWISAAATAWAAIALVSEIEPTVERERIPSARLLLAKHPRPAVEPPSPADRQAAATPATTPDSAFAREILPILQRSCVPCHGGAKPKGGLSVADVPALLGGGQSGGPAVVPGNPGASPLIRYVTDQVEDLEMPPLARRSKYPPLTPREVDQLRAWIAAGAR